MSLVSAIRRRDWRATTQRLAADDRARRWALATVVLLGLAIRVAIAWRWNLEHPNTRARLAPGDEPGYDSLARELLAGEGFKWPGRVPLYPLWLAFLHGVS